MNENENCWNDKVESWTLDKVKDWLEEKGWGHFASTFEKYGIYGDRFFSVTLAELVEYLPRTMTTYYERRKLLNEIRMLDPTISNSMIQKSTPIAMPLNISINTNLHDIALGGNLINSNIPPNRSSILPQKQQQQQQQLSDNTSSSSSSSPLFEQVPYYMSNSNTSSPTTSTPTRSSYSPKAAFNKIKNSFKSTTSDEQRPTIPARISSTPDKISKFWATYAPHHWYSSSTPTINKKASLTEQRIQITSDQETWYSLNVTKLKDPIDIKQRILNKLNFLGNLNQYQYFHIDGGFSNPDLPMNPHQLMHLCSTADHSASERILVKPLVAQQRYCSFIQPELGKSPTAIAINDSATTNTSTGSPSLLRQPALVVKKRYSANTTTPATKTRASFYSTTERSVGIQLSDPPPSHKNLAALDRQRSESEPFISISNTRPVLPYNSSDGLLSKPSSEFEKPTTTTSSNTTSTVGLWAIAPNNKNSSNKPFPQSQLRSQQLWAVIPSTVNTDTKRKTNFKKPTNNNTEFWGERPPAEIVFKHMEHYFDKQDLDKKVVVPISIDEHSTFNNSLLSRRLTYTKSIRLVAREASRKYTLARKEAIRNSNNTNSCTNKRLLRRKSTKLWGQKVVEVGKKTPPATNRSQQIIARLPSVSEHMILSHNSSQQEEQEELAPNSTVQWIRGKLIGKGSFGRVYLAFNVATAEMIAVKQVEIPKTASDLLNEQQHDMVEALYQEIILLRNLDHDNIVQYLGYGRDDTEGVINIFLEYVSGGSVASRLTLHGAFDEPLTQYFTRQICEGLAYLHSKHILHRDIKAANILVEVDGVCKISDFGLSKKNDYDEVYDENSRMSLRGSVYWMAPEVVKNDPYSAKVDIWSLGCTVIEMLTGQRPWLAMNQIAALYNLGRMNSPTIPETISGCAKDFLKQCFIIDPVKRPTATDLLNHAFLQAQKSFHFTDYVDKGRI